MKIFLAGATGAVGKRLVPLLVSDRHQVVATTRTADKMDALRAAGTEPVLLDALNRAAVMNAVVSTGPDVIVHQMTALTRFRNLEKLDEEFVLTNESTQSDVEDARRDPPS